MQIIRNLGKIKTSMPPLALTIGNFDGVHLGHLQIVTRLKKIAKEKNLASAILTFQPHPISFLRPDKPRDFNLINLSQKLKIFQELELDYAIILPFNKKFSEITAENFIREILVKALNIQHLEIGYDFTFGKNREGDFRMLEAESQKFHFSLDETSPVKNQLNDQWQTSSSTLIRQLISEGNIKEANKFLGRNFAICGVVNSGKKLAAQLGFPTANLKSKPHIIKPKFGVYKTATFIPSLNKKFLSITNFGIKPTIGGHSQPLFETHIPNFSEEIYDKKICIEFLDFIREEKKFSSLEELKKQIESDVAKLLIK